jgi:tRNA pseudouridine13 synthase
MSSTPRLKHHPEDFLVRENLLVPLTGRAEASHHYLLLRKSGHTTFEAIRLLAERFDCASRDISYAGLKDEDGITEQLLAVPLGVRDAPVEGGVLDLSDATGPCRLTVHHYGYGDEALEVGRLEGNSFRIVVRNLMPEVAERLAELRKISFFALNYYDTQRFGVPGGPKLTHLLGGCIFKGDWQGAFDLMLRLKAPETRLAEDWRGTPQAFFEECLDRRVVNFYLSAWASHEWNAELAELADESGYGNSYIETVDGIDYRYLTSSQAAAQLLSGRPELPYRRLSLGNEVAETSSPRATVVQVPLLVEAVGPDDAHPDRSSAAIRFALMSGCYATAVVRQLLTPLVGGAR